MEQEQGLSGFWSWLKRHTHLIAGICTAVGLAPLGVVIEAISASIDAGGESSGKGSGGNMGDNTMSKTGDYEPTSSEASILDAWVENKLTPFYQKLLIQIKLAFESANYSFQLQQINEIEMKMCVVRSYYMTHETTSLSLNAVNVRSKLIDTIFQPIEQMIVDSIASDGIQLLRYSVTVNDPAMFLPLNIQNVTIDCEKYVDNNGGYGNSQSLLTSNPVVVNPVTNQIIPHDTVSDNVKTKDNSNVLLVLLGLLGLTILFYPDKNKASDHNAKKKKLNNQIEKA